MFMPSSALAAIIIYSVMHLLTDPKVVWKYWVYQKTDFLAWCIPMIAAPMSSIQNGIFFSVGFGVAVLLYRIARPTISIMSRQAGLWKEAKSRVEISETGIAIVRIEESLVYPNSSFIADEVKDMIAQCTKSQEDPTRKRLWNEPTIKEIEAAAKMNEKSSIKSGLRALIIDCSSINNIDSTGLQCLSDIQVDAFRHAGTTIPILFVNVKTRLVVGVHTFHQSIAPLIGGNTELVESGNASKFMHIHSDDERNGCHLVYDNIDEALVSIPISW
jgi:sodium-independent sulfate anion transporter 11